MHSQLTDESFNSFIIILQFDSIECNESLFDIGEGTSEESDSNLLQHISFTFLKGMWFNMASQLNIESIDLKVLEVQHIVLFRHLHLYPLVSVRFYQEILLILCIFLSDVSENLDKLLRYSDCYIIQVNLYDLEVDMPFAFSRQLDQNVEQTRSLPSTNLILLPTIDKIFLRSKDYRCHQLIWMVLIELHKFEFELEGVAECP